MGLMEPGCKLEDFGRPAQPAAPNRLRCRATWWCLVDICVTFRVCQIMLPVHGIISKFFESVLTVNLLFQSDLFEENTVIVIFLFLLLLRRVRKAF